MSRLHDDANLAREIDPIEVMGCRNDMCGISRVPQNPLDLRMAALPHHDELVPLANEFLGSHVDFLDIRQVASRTSSPLARAWSMTWGTTAMGTDDERARLHLINRLSAFHAGGLKIAHDNGVMDEGAERRDGSAGAFGRHVRSSLRARSTP